ncbi:MAG TPA: SCP2 sterol-binding domain-containing protein [Acidimicrobiales bacterium]|nr:SCP2 sterol-binding domain-containing protein [Acidimicrobiales bacterium]
MARFLSREWFDDVNAAAASDDVAAAVTPGLRLVVQQVVTDGPEGDVRYAVRIEDGAVAVVPGDAPDPDVTVTEDHATATAVAQGELAAPVAFMTGRIRVSGDTRALLTAQPALHRLDAVFASVRERTTY